MQKAITIAVSACMLQAHAIELVQVEHNYDSEGRPLSQLFDVAIRSMHVLSLPETATNNLVKCRAEADDAYNTEMEACNPLIDEKALDKCK